MASVNRCTFIGNLTRDPDVRYLPSGEAVSNFSIACNEKWTDKSGKKQERAEFIPITMFGKQAEIAGQYLKKGSSVYIEGRLQTQKWVDKETQDEKQRTQIVADRMQMLGSRGETSATDVPQPETNKQTGSGFEDFEDDIPF